MAQVAPSILAADFANLAQDCLRATSKENPMLHFDVMDGVFVPNISIGIPVLKSLKKALPNHVYDVHLMIVRPDRYVNAFAEAGADYITLHVESESDVAATCRKIHAAGCKAGVSLRPGTPTDALKPYLAVVDKILVMSVEPGFGGQTFMPDAPERIRAIRRLADTQDHTIEIQVDGGINPQTAKLCLDAGADILVAGSAVFGSDNPAKAVDALLQHN